MRAYSIKKSLKLDSEKLQLLLNNIFGNYRKENDKFIVSYKALSKIEITLKENKLLIETESNDNKEGYEDTIKKYNQFLEQATGYTAKERSKK
ncbi:MAG: DUF5611 family protein [Thermoplasmata archaeon]